MEAHYCKPGGDAVVCKAIGELQTKLKQGLGQKNLEPFKIKLAGYTKEFCTGSGSHKTRCQAFKLISSKLPEFEKALKRGAVASDAAAKSATPKQPDSTPNSASDNRAKQVQKTAEQMLNTRKESAKVVQKAATKKDVPAKAAKPAEAAPPASGAWFIAAASCFTDRCLWCR